MTKLQIAENWLSCGAERSSFSSTPWWHPMGFICKPCRAKHKAEQLAEAMKKFKREEFSETDFMFNDMIVCPQCGTEHQPDVEDDGIDGDEFECDLCEQKFEVRPIIASRLAPTRSRSVHDRQTSYR